MACNNIYDNGNLFMIVAIFILIVITRIIGVVLIRMIGIIYANNFFCTHAHGAEDSELLLTVHGERDVIDPAKAKSSHSWGWWIGAFLSFGPVSVSLNSLA